MRALNLAELRAECATALQVQSPEPFEGLIKAALRRAAYILAPCSAADIIRFVAEPLASTQSDHEAIEDALDELIAYGDILEMRKIDSDPWDVPAVVLRPAPPTFIMRPSGDAIIAGVSGDMPSPLPAELTSQVHIEGPVRLLRSAESDLADHLRLLGLIQLSEHAWLRMPALANPEDHVAEWAGRLAAIPASPIRIDGLELIDSKKPATFYRGRWRTSQTGDNGHFVGRRPQLYGAKLWCFVELKNGIPQRIIDLTARDGFQRGCDLAWRLQAAIDASQGTPQTMTFVRKDGGVDLDFHSPLPSFAERRLALVAIKAAGQGALFRFHLPEASLQAEVAALQSSLWMETVQKGGVQ